MENVSMWDVFKEVLKNEVEEVKKKVFKDVADDYWAKEAIDTLSEKGIINGRTVDEFVPEGNITRAEFVTMLDRFVESSHITLERLEMDENKIKYSDVNSHWASKSIEKMTENRLLNGYPDGTFKPDEPINRAESAEILYRIIQKIP